MAMATMRPEKTIKSTKYDPNRSYVFSLSQIMNDNKDSIEKFCLTIKRRGYAYVRLPSNVVKKIDDCVDIINDFFNENKKQKNHI